MLSSPNCALSRLSPVCPTPHPPPCSLSWQWFQPQRNQRKWKALLLSRKVPGIPPATVHGPPFPGVLVLTTSKGVSATSGFLPIWYVRNCISGIIICIFLIRSKAAHIFIWLRAICLSFFREQSVHFPSPFIYPVIVFFFSIFRGTLFDTLTLCDQTLLIFPICHYFHIAWSISCLKNWFK